MNLVDQVITFDNVAQMALGLRKNNILDPRLNLLLRDAESSPASY